jgi:hypothetical protein
MRNASLPIAGQKKAGLIQLCFLIIHFYFDASPWNDPPRRGLFFSGHMPGITGVTTIRPRYFVRLKDAGSRH